MGTLPDETDKPERDEEALAAARRRVCEVFDALSIPYEVVSHPPIYSAFDRVRQEIEVDALICKNLFLRNKDKSRYYLFTLPIDKRADLVSLQKALGETRLSFGDADALWQMLRIRPGSVSLLNIIGAGEGGRAGNSPGHYMEEAGDHADTRTQPEREDKPLKFLIDSETLKAPRIGLHPNDNAATIVFPAERLPDIFARYGADFAFIDHA